MKNKKTLEEALNKFKEEHTVLKLYPANMLQNIAEFGAKWQQEQIGKSEFLQKLRATKSDAEARRLILEQFKNK
jgi:hypothetical protein